MQTPTIASFLDELEKISASTRSAGYLQARSGIRPIRVHNLLNRESSPNLTERDQVTQDPEIEPAENPVEEEQADINKSAAPFSERAMHGFAEARPYVAEGMKAGVPTAVLGNIIGGRKAGIVAGIGGAALGVTNEALKRWASKHKRKAVAKKLLENEE